MRNAHYIVKFIEMLDDELDGHGEDVATYNEATHQIEVASDQGVRTTGNEDAHIKAADVKRYAVVARFEHERHAGIADNFSFDVSFVDGLDKVPDAILSYEDYNPTVFQVKVWDLETGRDVRYARKVLIEVGGFSASL